MVEPLPGVCKAPDLNPIPVTSPLLSASKDVAPKARLPGFKFGPGDCLSSTGPWGRNSLRLKTHSLAEDVHLSR